MKKKILAWWSHYFLTQQRETFLFFAHWIETSLAQKFFSNQVSLINKENKWIHTALTQKVLIQIQTSGLHQIPPAAEIWNNTCCGEEVVVRTSYAQKAKLSNKPLFFKNTCGALTNDSWDGLIFKFCLPSFHFLLFSFRSLLSIADFARSSPIVSLNWRIKKNEHILRFYTKVIKWGVGMRNSIDVHSHREPRCHWILCEKCVMKFVPFKYITQVVDQWLPDDDSTWRITSLLLSYGMFTEWKCFRFELQKYNGSVRI